MALLATQRAIPGGLDVNFVAATGGGDTCYVNARAALIVRNGGGSAITVTLAVPGTDEFGVARADITHSVPAAGQAHFGPLTRGLMDTTDSLVHITYSGVTSVTVAVVQV